MHMTGKNTETVSISPKESIRRAYRIGRSWAINVPKKWVERYAPTDPRFVLVTINDDESITIRPLKNVEDKLQN